MSELRDQFRKSIEVKEDKTKTFLGYLGDGNGVVVVPDRNNFVWVTMSDGMVTQAYNSTVPPILNLPVVCGYDPRQKKGKLLCVLTVRNIDRVTQASTTQPLLTKHHASHEYLNTNDGTDVVWVELRQFVPLRPSIVAPYGIKIKRAVLQINGTWKQVGGVTVSLNNYIPTTQNPNLSGSQILSRYTVVSIDKVSGSPVVTGGSLVPLPTLALTDIPAYPEGNYPVCAVRMYHYQTQFYEAATMTDLIDLRFSAMTTATSGVTLPQSTTPVSDYYLTGYDAVSGSFSMAYVVSGSGGTSGSQVVPQSHTPVAGFYLTGYDAVSGSFASGSVVSGSSADTSTHNDLGGLQGGSADERYHLTETEHTIATQAAGSGTNGYLLADDWSKFNTASAGSGAWYLSELLDVGVGDQADGDALIWYDITDKWGSDKRRFAFDADFETGWSISGSASSSGGGDQLLFNGTPNGHANTFYAHLIPNIRYRVDIDVAQIDNGEIEILIGGTAATPNIIAPEVYSYIGYVTVTAEDGSIVIQVASGSPTGSITNFRVAPAYYYPGADIPGIPDSHAPVANYYLTGYDATSGSFSSGMVVGGSGTSGSQVVPISHVPVANFYLTGYDANSGSWTSGSVTGGTSGSYITDHTELTSIGTLTHDEIDSALALLAFTSGSNTGDQVVPDDHTPIENFYLTGYDKASGSFSSGSVVTQSSGSGGLEDAPIDGLTYGRNSGSWVEVVSGSSTSGSGVEEAPIDGKQYGRQDGAWTEIISGSGGGTSGSNTDGTIVFGWNAGTSTITASDQEIYLPFAGTIESWTILSDKTASVSIDLWVDTYANYPPTVDDTICGSNYVALSSANKNTDSTLTDWEKTFSAGDIMKAHINSIALASRLTLVIKYEKG